MKAMDWKNGEDFSCLFRMLKSDVQSALPWKSLKGNTALLWREIETQTCVGRTLLKMRIW